MAGTSPPSSIRDPPGPRAGNKPGGVGVSRGRRGRPWPPQCGVPGRRPRVTADRRRSRTQADFWHPTGEPTRRRSCPDRRNGNGRWSAELAEFWNPLAPQRNRGHTARPVNSAREEAGMATLESPAVVGHTEKVVHLGAPVPDAARLHARVAPPTSRENRRSTPHRPGHDQHARQSGLSLQLNRRSSPSCSAERCIVPLRLPTSSTSCRCSRAVRPRRARGGNVWDIAARAIASRRAISPVIRSASAARRSSRSSSGTLRYERISLSSAVKRSLIAAALVCVGVGCVVSTLSCFLPWSDLGRRCSRACRCLGGGPGCRGPAV